MSDRREPSIEQALRMQALELKIDALEQNLARNTVTTEKLLAAWEGSSSTVAFIKGCAIFGAAIIAIWTGVSKLWGH